MTEESTFRGCLFILISIIYVVRFWRTRFTRPPLCIAAMTLWALSLLAYASGASVFDVHLNVPEDARWFGAVLMVFAFPLPLWVRAFDAVGDYIVSNVSHPIALSHVDAADYQPTLNPVFVTFVICDIGVVLLSANAFVFATSMLSFVAMAAWVTKDYPEMVKHAQSLKAAR